jgi:hypothetical protein
LGTASSTLRRPVTRALFMGQTSFEPCLFAI